MPLTCGCSWDGGEPGQTCYYHAEDFEKLSTKKRKRCCSCNDLIDIGSLCLIFPQYKIPYHDIEVNIYGEDGEIPRAPVYHCEKCGEIWLNLQSVGFKCLAPFENMPEMLKEYQHEYAPPKLNL
jgi:hypothetical protein